MKNETNSPHFGEEAFVHSAIPPIGPMPYSIRDVNPNHTKPASISRSVIEEHFRVSDPIEDSYQDVFNSLSQMVIVSNNVGKIVSVNDAALFHLRYEEKSELINKKISLVIKNIQSDLNTALASKRGKSKNVPRNLEAELITKDDETIAVDLTISNLKNGEGIVYTMNESSNRLMAKNEQYKILQDLRNANQELREFAYTLSHDLKAPLRGISTLAHWLHEDNADTMAPESTKNLNLLISRTNRLFSFIDEVYKYAKIDQAKDINSKVDLSKLVPEVIDSLVISKDIKIDINHLPTLKASRVHMTQLFQNLISNAINHADREDVEISIGCEQKGNQWAFFVRDNGPGIPKEHHKRIFKVFQTLSPTEDSESTGIGLTIVKKIVDIYGGKITLDSKPGMGTCFKFTLSKWRKPNAEL